MSLTLGGGGAKNKERRVPNPPARRQSPCPAPFPLIHHLSTICPTHPCRLPPVLGGTSAPFPLPSYLPGCPFPRGNRFETFRVSIWGRCKDGVPTPTSGGAHSPEVIVSKRFAFRVARLLSACRFLAFPPWEFAARFLPFFPTGFFLASFLSLPLLLLLLLPLVARFLPFLARPFSFAALWLLLLPLLLLLLLLLPLVLLLSLLMLLLPLSLSLSLLLSLLLLLCG